jgi:uncharacterized protein YjiS (DUF1127 family)
MALFTDTNSTATGLTAAFDRSRAAFANYRARRAAIRRTFNELHSLDDRELADLGISRTDIPTIARQTAR